MRWGRLWALVWVGIAVVVTGLPNTLFLDEARGGQEEVELTVVEFAETLNIAASVSAGLSHSCALTSEGGIKCWGLNAYGELGDGSQKIRTIPVEVTGMGSGVSSISVSFGNTCILTDGGGVKCWGYNNLGQVGDGSTTLRLTPVDVVGLSSGVSDVSAGDYHTCALTSTGGVKCWGHNGSGQVGDGSTTIRLTPVDVAGLNSGVIAISAGGWHTCALTSTGGVKCWGFNYYGQLGDGSTTTRLTPVDVIGLNNGVSTISAGRYHTCALTSTGGVKCWGNNTYGQLGDGSTTTRLVPVDVAGLNSGVIAISAGGSHTCALTSTGGVKCWGFNEVGGLGDGSTTHRLTPVDVIGLINGVSTISAGGLHTCALTTNGGVKCWGSNTNGQLGDGSPVYSDIPVNASLLSSEVSNVSVGSSHTCELTTNGGVKCWGWNSSGQLGDGSTTHRLTPVDVVGLSSGVSGVIAEGHTCALTNSGGVKCWGRNPYGQLGDGSTENRLVPVDVMGLNSGVIAVAVGNDHTCALTVSGGVKCWGRNSNGQLGDGTMIDSLTPVDVVGLSSGVGGITVGTAHNCSLTSTGGVKCWGGNSYGQLGDGSTMQRLTPVDVVGLSSGVSEVFARGIHTCVLTITGGIKCWGYNNYGQVGDGSTTHRMTPVDVAGLSSGVSYVSLGYYHTCALTNTGGIKCWGYNSYGQLGDGSTTHRLTPVDVVGLSSGVNMVNAGGVNTCALISANSVKCWGSINIGQLGDGSAAYKLVPADVVGFEEVTEGWLNLPFSWSEHPSLALHNWHVKPSGKVWTWFDHDIPTNIVSHGNGNLTIFTGDIKTKNQDKRDQGYTCYEKPAYCYDDHDGYDFVLDGDSPILAAANGIIHFAGCGEYGYQVVVKHPNNYFTLYGHLKYNPSFSIGDPIITGQQLGVMGGTSGKSNCSKEYGEHLHFGVYYGEFKKDKVVDPSGWYGEIPSPSVKKGYPASHRLWAFSREKQTSCSPTGCTFYDLGNNLTVTIPSGYLSDDVQLSLLREPASPSPNQSLVSIGYSYLLGILGIIPQESNQLEIVTSLSNGLISLGFEYSNDAVKHLDEESLSFFRWNTSDEWELLHSNVDPDTNTIVGETLEMGLFDIQGSILCPDDPFIYDDTYYGAQVLTPSASPVYRVFDIADDEDWFEFYAYKGGIYTIETVDLYQGVDTLIELYDVDGTTLLDSDDNTGIGLASLLEFHPESSGNYFIRVTRTKASEYGCHSRYRIKLDVKFNIYLPVSVRGEQ
jgi:alpha-tubulin suppressor-like RCC1 family protein